MTVTVTRSLAGDRLARACIGLAAAACIGNGFAMTFEPLDWFRMIPGAMATGPANIHFIRDIGLAYGVSGSILIYALRDLWSRRSALLMGLAWLTLHAGLHVIELATGAPSREHFWSDAPGVLGIPLLVWVGLAIGSQKSPAER